MTVSVPDSLYREYVADGGATTRSIGFALRRTSDLVVAAAGVPQVEGEDYAVTGISPDQRILPLSPFWPSGTVISYWRHTAREQEYEIPAGVNLRNETLEDELDRNQLQQQEQDAEIARTVKAPRGEEGLPMAAAAELEGKFLAVAGAKIVGLEADIPEAASQAAAAQTAREGAEAAQEAAEQAEDAAQQEREAAEAARQGAEDALALTEAARDVATDLGNAPIYGSLASLPTANGTRGWAIIPYGTDEGIYEDVAGSPAAWTRRAPTQAVRAAESAAEAAALLATLNATLSELVAGTWTSTVTGSYLRADNGTPVVQAAWGYKRYDFTDEDVRDEAGKPIVELTFKLNTPSTVVAAAIYFNSSNVRIGAEYVGANTDIPLQTKLLDVPADAAYVVSDYQLTVNVPTFRVARVSEDIAERLTDQENLTAPVPTIATSLSAWEVQTPTYVNDRLINRTTGAVVTDTAFRYYVIDVNVAAGERLRILSGNFTSGATYAAIVCFSLAGGPTAPGQTVLGSFVTGNLSPQNVREVLIAAGNADGIPNLPSEVKSVALVNRDLEAPIVAELFHVVPNLADQVQALQATAGATGPITVWGESTGTTTNGIFDELQALYPARSLSMQAIGGQTFMDQVRYRMGILKTTITITGNQIPTSGTAACTLAHDILRPPASVTNSTQVMVQGVRCNLTRTGGPDDGSWVISAMDPISAARAVSPGSEVTVLTGFVAGSDPAGATPLATLLSSTNVLLCFFNDRFSTDFPGLANALAGAIEYVSRYSTRQLWVSPAKVQIMLPSTDSDAGSAASEAQAYGFLDHVRMMRRLMANIAPRHFDTTQFLIDGGGTEAKTISGVTFQVATLTASTVLLAADKTHLNAAGQTAQAAAIKTSLDGAGW